MAVTVCMSAESSIPRPRWLSSDDGGVEDGEQTVIRAGVGSCPRRLLPATLVDHEGDTIYEHEFMNMLSPS